MPDNAAYTRGVQIIHPRRPKKAIFTDITNGWFGKKNKEYAEYRSCNRRGCTIRLQNELSAASSESSTWKTVISCVI